MIRHKHRNFVAFLVQQALHPESFFQNSRKSEMNPPGSILDDVDRSILRALQADGRLSNAKLSEKLALSETPCWRRLKRLEADGFIDGYQARLNRKKLGYGVVAFVQVSLGNHAGETPLLFEKRVQEIPEILSCHNVTGDCDYMLQIVAKDLDTYGNFIRDQLRKLPGVASIQSSLSLREIKATDALPL